MHVAIDESWDDGESATIDAYGAFRDRDVPAGTNRCDLRSANEQGGLIENHSSPIDEASMVNRNGHELATVAV